MVHVAFRSTNPCAVYQTVIREEYFAALHRALHKVFPTGPSGTPAWTRLGKSLIALDTETKYVRPFLFLRPIASDLWS